MTLRIYMKESRLYCRFDKSEGPIFLSLFDYLNDQFNSDDPQKILEFYNNFESRDQLIKWMKERPKGVAHIREVEGDKDIIVVIPTADFGGKYATECRENIFNGLHIIFVDGGNERDFYFNYSHKCNIGIRKAMEYSPKWIVISNDDMYKIDDISTLKRELSKLDNAKTDLVFTHRSQYHSVPARFSKPRMLREKILLLRYIKSQDLALVKSLLQLENKFHCRYFFSPRTGFTFLLYKHGYNLISFTDFYILSSQYISNLNHDVFDETFVNAQEDHDLVLRAFTSGARYAIIDYRIGDYVGSTMGTGITRSLREVAGIVYLDYKWRSAFDLHKYTKTVKTRIPSKPEEKIPDKKI